MAYPFPMCTWKNTIRYLEHAAIVDLEPPAVAPQQIGSRPVNTAATRDQGLKGAVVHTCQSSRHLVGLS